MPLTKSGQTEIHWQSAGTADKPVLLLLHALGTDMDIWREIIPALIHRFRIIRIDLRGHGRSGAPQGPYTMGQLAKDVLAVLDDAGMERVTACGVSLGGMVAMEMALMAPERIERLILVCTSAKMDRAVWQDRIEQVEAGGLAAIADILISRFFSKETLETRPDIVAFTRSGLLEQNTVGYLGCCAAIRDFTRVDSIGEIKHPTMVVCGRTDIATPCAEHGSRIAAAIPGSTRIFLEAAHLPPVEAPIDLANSILRFMSSNLQSQAAGSSQDLLYRQGLKTRRAVLGDDWVDKSLGEAAAFNMEFQQMITRIAWQEIWTRPGLDQRTRRLLVLAITASLGRWEEFRLHFRSGIERQGFSVDEAKETLMQTAIYAGVPAANTAFSEAMNILRELQHPASIADSSKKGH